MGCLFGALILVSEIEAMIIMIPMVFRSAGLVVAIVAVVLFPLTLAIGPFVAGISSGNWWPLFFVYGVPLGFYILFSIAIFAVRLAGWWGQRKGRAT